MSEEIDVKEVDSALGKVSWVLWRQFDSSKEDNIKFAIITIGIATGVLAIVAATTAVMVTVTNWPIALLLLIGGIGVLTFSWFVGVHRFDELIFSES